MRNSRQRQQPPSSSVAINQDPLVLSAYNSPLPELQEVYRPAREMILQRAVELGYDRISTLLHPVNWITDLDGNDHVKAMTYFNVLTQISLKFVETFWKVLGPEAYQNLFEGQGVGFAAKEIALEFKKQASYPDVVSGRYLVLPQNDEVLRAVLMKATFGNSFWPRCT
jgi:hypothetical protein